MLEASHPLPAAVQQIVESACTLFSVTGSGVMFVDDAHVLRYLAASDRHGRELEAAQEEAGTGPCVEALIRQEVVTTPDVTTDARWPEIQADLAATRVRAVVGVPIRFGGTAIGSIDAYRDREGPWREEEVSGLLAYAGLVERILLSAMRSERQDRTVQQLQHALEHRVTIERAVGVLMEREGLDAVAAFERLRTIARTSRRRAADVAADVLAGRPVEGPRDRP
jgi:GAF domain-containing protein